VLGNVPLGRAGGLKVNTWNPAIEPLYALYFHLT
jgi:hypothetical protein